MYNSRAHTRVWHCVFYSMLPIHTQSFTNLYKHTVQIVVRANTHTLPLELSLSHTPTHSQSYSTTCQYCGQAFLEPLLTHSPLAVLADRRWGIIQNGNVRHVSPIRPLSSKPNIRVFLSVCTRLVIRSSEKKAPAYENVWEWLSDPSLVCKATVTDRRSFYCIYMV